MRNDPHVAIELALINVRNRLHRFPETAGLLAYRHHVGEQMRKELLRAQRRGQCRAIDNCTSHHHQGIDRLGDGLDAVGWSEDGLVEAVETSSGDGWVLGVQWHPEMSADDDPVQQGLFDAFVSQLRRA